MAARLAGYTTTTAVLGGNRTMKVHQWHAYSEPSETYFEFTARTNVTTSQAQGLADTTSDHIEQVLAAVDVTDVAWSQDVTPSGQLIGIFTVYYYIADSQVSGWVEVPYTRFSLDEVALAIVGAVGFGPSQII